VMDGTTEKPQVSKVSWDEFEVYCRCPQWYLWAHLPPTRKVTNPPYKDSQHLVRGNASQAVVTAWANSEIWKNENHNEVLPKFLDCVRKYVLDAWIDNPTTKESPDATPLEITEQVTMNLRDTLPKLLQHIKDQFLGNIEHVRLRPEVDIRQHTVINQRENTSVDLTCRLDLVAEGPGAPAPVGSDLIPYKSVIYEGKATRKPKYRTEDQLRWQVDVYTALLGVHPPLADEHYYVFYETATLRPVKIYNDTQREWVEVRNTLLQRLLDGDFKATPSSSPCKICRYQRICPDVHQPKRRNITPAMEPPKRGKKVNVL